MVRRKTFNQRRSDRGGGCSTPRPGEPLPQGAIPHRRTATGEHPLTRFPVINSPKILFFPVHRIRGYRQTLPAPLRGREEAAERPGGGGGL